MSGFLRTLARRVLQPETSIRPRTISPLAGPPAAFEFEDIPVPAETPVGPQAGMHRAGEVEARTRRIDEPEPVSNSGGPPSAAVKAPKVVERDTDAARPEPEGNRSGGENDGGSLRPLRSSAADPDRIPVLVAPMAEPAAQTTILRDSKRIRLEVAASRPRERVDLRTRRAANGLRRDVPGARDTESDPAEIHVTIGRVELTAVTAPSAPKRTSSAARKPMSLEEYLQRRERET
jgi:hypothetical protein